MNNSTDGQLKNWWGLSLTALLLSIQALLLMMKVLSFFAVESPLVYLGLWLVFFIAGQIIAVRIYHYNRAFLIVEAVLTFFLLSAWVKMIFYDYRAQMAQRAYMVLLILAVLNKLFWPQIRQIGTSVYARMCARANAGILRPLILVGGSVFLALIIFVPNFERVLARMYVGEQFFHYDMFMMASGWAAANSHIIYVDQFSSYGMGMPYVFAQLARWMGGFSYEHVFLMIMTGVMIYYVVMFWFASRWFKSVGLALAVMLLGIRVQMFIPGTILLF